MDDTDHPPLVAACRLPGPCWEVEGSDEHRPHFATEAYARVYADGSDDGTPDLPVTALPAPCWVAECGTCGEHIEDDDLGPAHYRTFADAENACGHCPGGCEQPDERDSRRPANDRTEPIPGLSLLTKVAR